MVVISSEFFHSSAEFQKFLNFCTPGGLPNLTLQNVACGHQFSFEQSIKSVTTAL